MLIHYLQVLYLHLTPLQFFMFLFTMAGDKHSLSNEACCCMRMLFHNIMLFAEGICKISLVLRSFAFGILLDKARYVNQRLGLLKGGCGRLVISLPHLDGNSLQSYSTAHSICANNHSQDGIN